jgi:hypothetical protein
MKVWLLVEGFGMAAKIILNAASHTVILFMAILDIDKRGNTSLGAMPNLDALTQPTRATKTMANAALQCAKNGEIVFLHLFPILDRAHLDICSIGSTTK